MDFLKKLFSGTQEQERVDYYREGLELLGVGRYHEALTSFRVVKAFGRERYETDRFAFVGRGRTLANPAAMLVERLGGSSLLHARVEGLDNLLTVELSGTFEATAGTAVRLRIAEEQMHVFDRVGRTIA